MVNAWLVVCIVLHVQQRLEIFGKGFIWVHFDVRLVWPGIIYPRLEAYVWIVQQELCNVLSHLFKHANLDTRYQTASAVHALKIAYLAQHLTLQPANNVAWAIISPHQRHLHWICFVLNVVYKIVKIATLLLTVFNAHLVIRVLYVPNLLLVLVDAKFVILINVCYVKLDFLFIKACVYHWGCYVLRLGAVGYLIVDNVSPSPIFPKVNVSLIIQYQTHKPKLTLPLQH